MFESLNLAEIVYDFYDLAFPGDTPNFFGAA